MSIIIVCRNPGPRLRAALASIWAQQSGDFEIVVIDGASNDGTREWLESIRPQLGWLVSEPDDGIYEAMNKGVAAAQGEWVLFLGADDRLEGTDALSSAANFLRDTSAGVVVGEAKFDDGRIYQLGENLTAVRRNFVHHQAAFYRRSLFRDHGAFETALRIMGDYEFNLRLRKAGVGFAPLSRLIAKCASGGLSDAGGWTGYREEISVRHRYFPAWQCWPWDVVAVGRYLRKKLIRSLRSHG